MRAMNDDFPVEMAKEKGCALEVLFLGHKGEITGLQALLEFRFFENMKMVKLNPMHADFAQPAGAVDKVFGLLHGGPDNEVRAYVEHFSAPLRGQAP